MLDEAMKAAARVGSIERLIEFESEGLAVAHRLKQPFEIARISLAAAVAWHEMGFDDRALIRAEEAIRLATDYGYHELLARAEMLQGVVEAEGPSLVEADSSPNGDWGESPEFMTGIERLGALGV
jgi:hypothetical protein